jgi:uncharacterized membrane protein YecN with MAPEG domain
MKLEITLIIAAAAALINIWLAMRVARVRMAEKISVGDGGNELLIRRMRAQANFVENTPFVLVLLALCELACGSSIWLWAVAIVYILGRILHAFGMDGRGRLRETGTLTTMLTLLILAGYALWIAYSGTVFEGWPAETTISG